MQLAVRSDVCQFQTRNAREATAHGLLERAALEDVSSTGGAQAVALHREGLRRASRDRSPVSGRENLPTKRRRRGPGFVVSLIR